MRCGHEHPACREATQVVTGLVEGLSSRATVRMTGVAKNTVTKLLVTLGDVCWEFQDKTFRDLACKRMQVDEIWSFIYSKQRNVPPEFEGVLGRPIPVDNAGPAH